MTQLTPNAPRTGWTITSQSRTIQNDASNTPVRGIEVYFTTGKGATASVFIPDAQYTPDNVRARVADFANRLDQVQGATG